jgi:predicted peptidase
MNIQFTTEKQLSAEKQLSFLLALPDEYESQDRNWPLVVFLHGAGKEGRTSRGSSSTEYRRSTPWRFHLVQ